MRRTEADDVRVRPVTDDELAPIWPGIVADDLNPQRDGAWFGAYRGDEIVGALHVVQVGGHELLDDAWVRPDRRRQGVGGLLVRHAQDGRSSLWLIADPDGVAYYRRFGFEARDDLPAPIARRYASLGLWPGHLGHLHVAMRWRRA